MKLSTTLISTHFTYCCIVLKLWFPQLCQLCSDLKGRKICVRVLETDRFYPPCAAEGRMNARYSACRAFCIYWSSLALAAMSLGQQREDMLIPASGGVGQKKSKNENDFSQTDLSIYHLEAWMTFWMTKAKTKGIGGLIYYHVRWGLFIKPQVLVAQLWCAEWWLMEVEDDESHALYGVLSFYLPLCLHQSLTHSSPNTPSAHQQHQQPLWLPVSCISSASFFLLWFFSDHQDADLQGSDHHQQPPLPDNRLRSLFLRPFILLLLVLP